MNKTAKILIKFIVITGLVFVSLQEAGVDIRGVAGILTHINFTICCLIICAFILNFHLVATRSYYSYKQFKINISYFAAKEALLSSLLGGVVPVFGSVISQAIKLKQSSKLSSTTSSFLFFYDKIIMAMTGAILSFICACFMRHNWLPFRALFISTNSTSPLEFIIALILCFVTVYIFTIPKNVKEALSEIINFRTTSYVLVGMLLSTSAWILSACCFVVCIKTLSVTVMPQIDYQQLFYASIIVSFLASMPISVNGWGIREFAAVTIFSLINVQTEVALSSALIVGVLSTLSLFANALLLNMAPRLAIRKEIESYSE